MFGDGIANLFPGYFALVMATGIVSIACQMLGFAPVAKALLAVNAVAYVVLTALTAVRLVRHFGRIVADFQDHGRGPGFFTLVAGTCVFGNQLLIVADQPALAYGLWLAGIALWLVVMYAFFTAVVVRENKPTLEAGLNGAWLLATVATQSVALLGALLAEHHPEGLRDLALFFSLAMYLVGAMLYLTIIPLIFYRFTFLEMTTARLTPPYWINMGAVAITTLTGSTFLLVAPSWSLLVHLRPFVTGLTLFFWAAATWWIPLLLILGVWRHVRRRFPFTYDPQYWGMVFPIGMYTACTFRLARTVELDFIAAIPAVTVYAAIAAWLVVFAYMLRHFLRSRA